MILPSNCGSAEERLTCTEKVPASACQAAAFSSYQVKLRASSGTVTWRVCPASRTTRAKPFSSPWRPRNLPVIFADVDLSHVGPGPGSGVRYIEADLVRPCPRARMNLKTGILEAGIREPVAKRE